jgi:hypothetical protein
MLYEVERCQGIFVDACIRDEAGRLLMLSAYGRDTAIKELLARMQLGAQHQDGLQELTLKPQSNDVRSQKVFIGNAKDLDKLTGRLPKCVYGNLNHLWLYNPVILAPVKGADVAWVIEQVPKLQTGQTTKAHQLDHELVDKIKTRLWAAIGHLASIPLLPHWRDPVIAAIEQSMLLRMGQRGHEDINQLLSEPIGDFVVLKVALDQSKFAQIVTDLVRTGRLDLEPQKALSTTSGTLPAHHTMALAM